MQNAKHRLRGPTEAATTIRLQHITSASIPATKIITVSLALLLISRLTPSLLTAATNVHYSIVHLVVYFQVYGRLKWHETL